MKFETKTVKVVKEMEVEEVGYTLTLNEQEIKDLYSVCMYVGGPSEDGPRGTISKIEKALRTYCPNYWQATRERNGIHFARYSECPESRS